MVSADLDNITADAMGRLASQCSPLVAAHAELSAIEWYPPARTEQDEVEWYLRHIAQVAEQGLYSMCVGEVYPELGTLQLLVARGFKVNVYASHSTHPYAPTRTRTSTVVRWG